MYLHSGGGLIDPPRPAGCLPQRKEVIAHGVEDNGGKGIEVKAGFHAARVGNEHLQTVLDTLVDPVLPLIRSLRRISVISQEFWQVSHKSSNNKPE